MLRNGEPLIYIKLTEIIWTKVYFEYQVIINTEVKLAVMLTNNY